MIRQLGLAGGFFFSPGFRIIQGHLSALAALVKSLRISSEF